MEKFVSCYYYYMLKKQMFQRQRFCERYFSEKLFTNRSALVPVLCYTECILFDTTIEKMATAIPPALDGGLRLHKA